MRQHQAPVQLIYFSTPQSSKRAVLVQPSAIAEGFFYLITHASKQKPRKKGQRARDLAVRKKFVRGKFKDADDARRTIASLERQKTRQRRRCEQLGWLLGFQEKDSLLEAFTLSFFALERWPTTTDYSTSTRSAARSCSARSVTSALGVAEQDLLEDIQHAAFMTVVCARLRNHGKADSASQP
ncbi:MAG: hypothetical protein ACLUNV_09245 [Sutterella wadsworthensis]